LSQLQAGTSGVRASQRKSDESRRRCLELVGLGTKLAVVPDEITIDWSTAEVKALPTTRLELHVHLTDQPDSVWHTAFSVAATEHPAARSLDWGKASVEGTILGVGDMVHSVDIEKMKGVLDETVADANERAKHSRQAELDQVAEQNRRTKDVERLAQEMTDRLRGGDSQIS
jgi:hypothetical protein